MPAAVARQGFEGGFPAGSYTLSVWTTDGRRGEARMLVTRHTTAFVVDVK